MLEKLVMFPLFDASYVGGLIKIKNGQLDYNKKQMTVVPERHRDKDGKTEFSDGSFLLETCEKLIRDSLYVIFILENCFLPLSTQGLAQESGAGSLYIGLHILCILLLSSSSSSSSSKSA
jgi:hypothetical protein